MQLAQGSTISGSDLTSLQNSIGFRFANARLGTLFNGSNGIVYLAFIFAGFGLILYTLSGGYQIMLSRGDPKALEEGKRKILYAIVGFIIVFSSYWIVQIVKNVLGISKFNEVFG